MRKLFLFAQVFLPLSCLCFYSCENTDNTEGVEQEELPPETIEAMNYLKTKELSLPDMHQTSSHPTVSTRSAMAVPKTLTEKKAMILPDWSSLQTYRDEREDVRLFSLKDTKTPLSGFVYTRIKGKEERLLAVSTSKLALWKVKGRLIGRIITYLPDRKFLKAGHDIKELGYKLEGSEFSGFCLVSTLDGKFLYGDKYEKGQHLFHFMHNPNIFNHKTNNKTNAPAATAENENLETSRIYIALFTESSSIQSLTTYSDIEEDNFICSFCGLPADSCTCITITPGGVRCPICGALWGSCSCLSDGNEPENGGNNGSNDDYEGPSGGGSGTGSSGGGNSGGNSGSEGSGSGSGDIVITSPNQRPVKNITQAASDAVDKVLKDHNYDTETAHCNEGVRNVFYNLYQSKELYNMRANDMVKYWKNHPGKWEVIRMDEAQELANQGFFVVAGWINTKGSGHVCLVVPGKGSRGKWDGVMMNVPNTMDTGAGMRDKSQPITRSFGKNKHNGVIFFKYK
ncbi:hypothetical protein [Bacteroides acidifaciens]|uniref:hypothetical protein n=1 Tax=Bacteroides acidifaciens TaxID=85831 RepID=UPI0025874D56|nr:hypothetical protein [Bacteroides acidifaciens]